jgi:hypothetical protein
MRNKLDFLKILWSPFKPFKLKWYVGKTAVGTPYFYPRKWVKATPELARKATLSYIEREESYNKLNPNYARKIRPYEEVYQENMRCTYPVPKKIGFDFVGLGFKTKWTDTDYRFEWAPLLSFVFFGYQSAIMVYSPYNSQYWEAWLYYDRNTDKTKSKRERIEQCRKEYPQTYEVWEKGEEGKIIDYYDLILRKKYLK